MAEFEENCPHCQCPLIVQEEWIGMETVCPSCQQRFVIQPNQPSAPPPPAQMTNGGTFTFVCPSCEAVAELPVSRLGQKYECQMCFEEHVAKATTERQCPFCGQTVKYHASICKFCKADLTRTPPGTGSSAKPVQEEKFIFICPECDAVTELPISMKGQQYECKSCCETSVANPAEERKCPHCGEKIKIKATVCKHCKKTVKPLTPSAASGGVQQMLTEAKTIGSKLFGGRLTPQMQPVDKAACGKAAFGIPEAETRFLRNFGLCYLCLAGISVFISLLAAFIPALAAIRILLDPVLFVFFCIWIYKLWKQVPVTEAETTPGKAVGFIFIPIYDLYWLIRMPLWLSKHYDRSDNDSGITASKCWIIYIISNIISMLICIIVSCNNGNEAVVIQAVYISNIFLLVWLIRMQHCLQSLFGGPAARQIRFGDTKYHVIAAVVLAVGCLVIPASMTTVSSKTVSAKSSKAEIKEYIIRKYSRIAPREMIEGYLNGSSSSSDSMSFLLTLQKYGLLSEYEKDIRLLHDGE